MHSGGCRRQHGHGGSISTIQKWHEGDSYLQQRSRISGAIYAYNQWLTGDVLTGNIQQISTAANDEVGQPLRLRIESGPVQNFPAGETVGRADFYFATGVGDAEGPDPVATDPDVEISWSDDGGITWSNPILRKLGRQSGYYGPDIACLVHWPHIVARAGAGGWMCLRQSMRHSCTARRTLIRGRSDG